MKRQFALIALSLVTTVTTFTACNNGGKKRVTLTKTQRQADEKASDSVKKLNKTIADSKCLRVDTLVKELVKMKTEQALIYTADINYGLLSAGANNVMSFEGQLDEKARANGVLNKEKQDPTITETTTSALEQSDLIRLLPYSMDDKCTLADVATGGPKNFEVVKKSANDLWLRNKSDQSYIIRYQYNMLGKLTITEYAANDEVVCGKTPRMKMRKFVLAWDAAMKNVEIDRSYAELISANLADQAELKAALGKNVTLVSMPVASYKTIRQSLLADSFTRPACP